jgi:hypothetical protein
LTSVIWKAFVSSSICRCHLEFATDLLLWGRIYQGGRTRPRRAEGTATLRPYKSTGVIKLTNGFFLAE